MKKLSESELKQKKYYNEISGLYDRNYGSLEAIAYRKFIFNKALKNVSLKDAYVLDAMCGGGQNTAALQGFGANFLGVDLSEEQCLNYKKRFPNTEIRCASMLSCGLPSNTFDIVICDSLHHLHPYVNEGICELIRVLKPGGHLLIWEPSAGSIFDRVRQFWYRTDKKFFQENEAAIDLDRISARHSTKLKLERVNYAGNFAYLFVFAPMAFRIPSKFVPYYAPVLMKLEGFFAMFQTKISSLWVLALYKKY
jgi:SAM-dependent methyltransferase